MLVFAVYMLVAFVLVNVVIYLVKEFTVMIFETLLWLAVKLPLGIILMVLGLVFCITVKYYPTGCNCFEHATGLLFFN